MLERPAVPLTALVLALATGCADGGPPQEDPSDTGPARESDPGSFQGRIYERRLVFSTLESDSPVIVPVFFSARTVPGGVVRRARGWLARGGDWETVFDDRWQTPPSRAPWRPLPREGLRIVVGEEDGLEAVVYESGPTALQLDLEAGLVEWTGPEGDAFRLHEGVLRSGGQELPGRVLEMSRARRGPDPTAGDWTFLVSGDTLAVLLESPRRQPPDADGAFVGFGRLDYRDLRWPEVTVDWAETRSYEPARRDIPMAWSVTSPGAEIHGSLEATAVQLAAGEGDGPVLPVEALYAVAGRIRIQGWTYPVTGLYRLRRP